VAPTARDQGQLRLAVRLDPLLTCGATDENSANAPVRQTYDRLAAVYDRGGALHPGDDAGHPGRLALRRANSCSTSAVYRRLLRELVLESAAPRLCGVDLSLAMLACARASLPPASARPGRRRRPALPSGSFDVVVSISSFH